MRCELLVAPLFVVSFHLIYRAADGRTWHLEHPCAFRATPTLKILSFDPYQFTAHRLHSMPPNLLWLCNDSIKRTRTKRSDINSAPTLMRRYRSTSIPNLLLLPSGLQLLPRKFWRLRSRCLCHLCSICGLCLWLPSSCCQPLFSALSEVRRKLPR
jgi:hypothetical protein